MFPGSPSAAPAPQPESLHTVAFSRDPTALTIPRFSDRAPPGDGVPPPLDRLGLAPAAARFTMAESAVLAVIAAEVARRGLCRLTVGRIEVGIRELQAARMT